MFRFFRKRREAVKKYLLIFFLSVVSIGMVITLAPIPTGDTSRMEMNKLAEIDGHSITTQDLQQTIQSRFRNSPLGYDPKMVPVVAGPVLDEMILRRALEAQAKKLGLEVSDQELFQALQGIPWLYPNGTFVGEEQASNLIQLQAGMTISQFEAVFRENLLQDKVRAVITDAVRVTSAEVRAEFLQRNNKAKIEYVLFDPSQFMKAVEVTPEAVEGFFKKAPERYKLPEQRRVRYTLVAADSVRAQVKLGEDELRQYYTQHLSDYRVPERVKVAHILFKTTGKNPSEIVTIEKTARDVLGQVRSGKDFGELAKKYSEDSSASNGGEIGWVVRGQTVKDFESAAFSMKPGQVSDLIKTIYGIHILKVLDKQDAHLQSFDEVKGNLRTTLEKEKLDAAEQALAEKLERELRANPQAFEAASRKAGLEVKETPLFRYNQTIPDFGNSESFSNLAFQLHVGEVGTPLTIPKGLAIIQVAEVVPEHLPKLDEVRARVEEDYRAEQSRVVASEKAREFAAKCKTGDFEKVAKSAGFAVKESKDFAQQDYVEGVGSGSQLAAAFSLAPGQSSDVVSSGANSVVFRIVSHTPANEPDLAAQQDRIAEELLGRKRDLAFEIYRKNLKEQLLRSKELKLNDAGMKQFLASYQRQ